MARGDEVKVSGFGRVVLDVADTLRAVVAVDSFVLIFGTDLPSTRARRPFAPTDVEILHEALGIPFKGAVSVELSRKRYGMDDPEPEGTCSYATYDTGRIRAFLPSAGARIDKGVSR